MAPWPWWGACSLVLGAQDIAFSRMSLGKMPPFCIVSPGDTDTGPGQTQLPLNHGLGFAASSTEGKLSDVFPEMQALDGNQIVFPLRYCQPVHGIAGPSQSSDRLHHGRTVPVVCAHRSGRDVKAAVVKAAVLAAPPRGPSGWRCPCGPEPGPIYLFSEAPGFQAIYSPN